MRILTSWDDGSVHDIRMADLLKEYEMPGIFFIPTVGNQLSESDIKDLAKDFTIGGHTTTHPLDLKRLSYDEAYNEIRDNKEWLEDVIQDDIDWFCYPRGRYNEETIDIVKDIGFKYARTTMVGHTEKSDNPYRIHTAVHVLNGRNEYNDLSWFDYAIKQYKTAKACHNGYYHIWGHSWEIEKHNLWRELEELLKYIYEQNNNK